MNVVEPLIETCDRKNGFTIVVLCGIYKRLWSSLKGWQLEEAVGTMADFGIR